MSASTLSVETPYLAPCTLPCWWSSQPCRGCAVTWLRFPADEILIYGTSLCIVVPFILEMLAFHHLTPPGKQFWSHASLIFTIIYAVFVSANYVVQLATVIPES